MKNPLDYELLRKKRAELKAEKFLNFKDSLYGLQENYINKLLLNKTLSKPFLNWLEAEKLYAYPSSFSFFNLHKFKKNTTQTDIKDLSNINLKTDYSKYNLFDLPTVKSEYLINGNISDNLSQNIFGYYMFSNQAEIAKLPVDKRFNFILLQIKKENIDRPFLTQILFIEFVSTYLNKKNTNVYENNLDLINDVLDNSIFKDSLLAKYKKIKKNIIIPIKE
ncbi:hypothetical protein SAMN05216503_1503 [Polaribacter sp. KT25b]|uniref:hypothetical protein n=1 Tax=Polaribacter sp. KT25b TaxID=1855336 RepID=UPI000879E63C|nr:hypothetical protein [Polaribacter sp. KT25b]SDR95518.1 hypothetical protein SAMN05216503_1503 [Polaribacter sp. KT25b]